MKTTELEVGQRVNGIHPAGTVEIKSIQMLPGGYATVIVTLPNGDPKQLTISDQMPIELELSAPFTFDAEPESFKLALEAKRMELAGIFDPFVAVSTSNLEALPHQLSAVYGELLERVPLRFLLADEPGAGKTIMAGLLIKELLLRGYLKRCLIVCPGSLSDQWVGELKEKFGLGFRQVTKDLLDSAEHVNPFMQGNLFVARMDQLARAGKTVQDRLDETEWDLVIVDEAHRMSAQQGGFNGEAKRTMRYRLGQRLSKRATHFLLMTATPHTGNDENFHLFLSLLDQDVFAGQLRPGETKANLENIMLRRIKENLVDIEGRKLFPPRKAVSAAYELSELELKLYEAVTSYVREEMARAMSVLAGDKRRQGNVSFALTILQRRLASSPEAILTSLKRRRQKLQDQLEPGQSASVAFIDEVELDAEGELSEAEIEEVIEAGVLDGMSIAKNSSERALEVQKLDELIALAEKVRESGTDSKWQELKAILESEHFVSHETGEHQKLIIFTEHRDTLSYLEKQISKVLGEDLRVITIHGGDSRQERKKAQTEFTNNPDCPILVATDAAGEGINLQRAHLMVNYDLPWNPNRIEQRFGRIHRIGQKHECTLWNLVSSNTREGNVYARLLEKIQIQNQAYDGNLFHVLGGEDLFEGESLSDLMIKAILNPEKVPELVEAVDKGLVDAQVAAARENALVSEVNSRLNSDDIVRQMNDAKARRLAPGYVAQFFLSAFKSFGGVVQQKEESRFKIANVPMALQNYASANLDIGEIATKYERVTFDPAAIEVPEAPPAELVVPGTPLMTATVQLVLQRFEPTLLQGATLFGSNVELDTKPRFMLCFRQDLVNSFDQSSPLDTIVNFIEVDFDGNLTSTAIPPHIDYEPMPPEVAAVHRPSMLEGVPIESLIQLAKESFVGENLTERLPELEARVSARADKLESEVSKRLDQEAKYWANEAITITQGGKSISGLSAAQAKQKSEEIKARKAARLSQLAMERVVLPKDAELVSIALIVPPVPTDSSGKVLTAIDQEAIRRVERRAVDLTMDVETNLGHKPLEMARNNPGFDIKSQRLALGTVFIEVKGRADGAKDFKVTDNELSYGITQGDSYFLSLVRVASGENPAADEVRYIQNPFVGMMKQGGYVAHVLEFDYFWEMGLVPHVES